MGVAAFLVSYSFSIQKPTTILPANTVIHPPKIAVVVFPNGSSQQSSTIHIDPETATVVIGVNNTVEWINRDNVPSSVVSDSNYVDPIGGNFSSFAQLETGYILPGQTFNFTFTQVGNYSYHSIPHPFTHGKIIVLS